MTSAHIKQPNSTHCFVCGLQNPHGLKAEFHDDGRETVISHYTIPKDFEGYPGVAHGGIVASILDEAVGRVPMIGAPNRFMMTVKIEIKYRQPVPVAQPLTIVGRLVKLRGRLCVATGELQLADGSVAAEATATLAALPEHYSVDGDLEALGWKVYD